MTIHAHNPAIQVEFYSRRHGGFTVTSPQRYMSNRTLENPTATAQVMFRDTRIRSTERQRVKNMPWEDAVAGNDLCRVTIMGRDGKRHADIIGVVKRVEVFEIEMSGQPERHAHINIEGIGAELQNYRIFWHPHIAGRNNLGGLGYLARSKGKIAKGQPHEVLKSLFETFFNDEYVFRFADGETLPQKIDFRAEPSSISLGTTGLSALGAEAALWNTLKRYADQPWHELFVDIQHERELINLSKKPDRLVTPGVFESTTRSQSPISAFMENQAALRGKVGLYHRPTPFTLDRWSKLSQSTGWGFTFDDTERIDDGFELHRDTSRIYSMFFVPAKATFSAFDQLSNAYDQSGGILPIYDADLVKRFGFRDLTQGTEYIQYITQSDASHGTVATSTFKLWELLAIRTLQLYQWYGYTDFWDGMFATMGRIGPDPEKGIRIGSILSQRGTNWQYYVTGVQQFYQFPGNHTTRITVERGRDQQKYVNWWVSKMQGKYSDALSTTLPQWLLERVGLWPKGRDLKVPLGNVPSLPEGLA